ncbi:MAG: hypothetical protein WCL14_07495 [Bacteroidota bacterium]
MITIKKVENSADKKLFIDFPHDLYKDDKNYVPELFIAQSDLMDPKKNPFFKHSKADLYLALKDGKVVGRISAIRNNNYNEFANAKVGFFGFFDVVNDYEVAKKLFDTVADWMKKEGLTSIIGPTNFSTNETCGLLIDGLDAPPMVMMTYNAGYYKDFLEKYGFGKQMDLVAYVLDPLDMPEKLLRLSKGVEERLNRRGITIREINMKDFANEVEKVKVIYNAAWDKNWGFVPMTDDEFKHMGKDMKMILDKDFAYVAEENGRMIGFSLTIPNVNEIFATIKRGRLFPTGIFKLLLNKSKITSVRVITLGVLEEYRKLGIDVVFYAKNMETARRKKIKYAEASWILESNKEMNSPLISINAKKYKTYRIFEKKLA